jgi:flagellar hook-basal body complex protein FliE
MKVERADINQLLQQMRQMQTQLHEQRDPRATVQAEGLGRPAPLGGAERDQQVPGFGALLQQAVGSVNDVQQQAGALATAYEKGDTQVSLAQVMVASQKATVSFQALTQVRNRLVDAYKDIMNMPM